MPNPSPKRRGCSIWTLMGCGCGLAALIGIAFVFFTLGVLTIRERTNPRWNMKAYQQCQTNLRYLGRAFEIYREDHGRLPADLSELKPYIHTTAWLHCPFQKQGGTPYRYTPSPAKPGDPLVTCANHAHGPVVLLHNGRLKLSNESLKGTAWKGQRPSRGDTP